VAGFGSRLNSATNESRSPDEASRQFRLGSRPAHTDGEVQNAGGRVCTICTPWASDSPVLLPDGPGFRMFPAESSVFRSEIPFEFNLGHIVSASD
jgi:hypothetical protein